MVLLPAPLRPDERERLALLHREVEALQDVGLAPFEPNTAEGDFEH